jgi:hypothetical protein
VSHSAVKNPGASAICGEYTRAYSTTPFEGRVLDFFLSIYAGLLAHLGVPQPRTPKDLQSILEVLIFFSRWDSLEMLDQPVILTGLLLVGVRRTVAT